MTELPLDIVDEMLSFLSPIQQGPCLRVCYLWNSLLFANANTCRVEIDITLIQGYRQLADRIHTAVTASTKMLILSGGGGDTQRRETFNNLKIVRNMLGAMHLRTRFIIISGVAVDARYLVDSFYSGRGDSDVEWRIICGSLILQNVNVFMPLNGTSRSVLMVGQDLLDVEFGVGANVLEKWCPELSGAEMGVFEGTVRLVWEQTEERQELWTLLCCCQMGDERFPPYAPGAELPIPAGILSVPPMASLRKLTVWALASLEFKYPTE